MEIVLYFLHVILPSTTRVQAYQSQEAGKAIFGLARLPKRTLIVLGKLFQFAVYPLDYIMHLMLRL